ncbi:MAG TPA: TIGR01244 family sulfur transferase [Aliidongia sp.]|nr:TIGR01244 family sulfur transferase [Aliidongia sp.]
MQPVKISDKLSVMGQPSLTDFPSFAADGFTAIINDRPDGEEPGQPGTTAEAKAAEAAGLGYAHIPVAGPNITEGDVRRFQAAIAAADGPVLAHCKSGLRSATLHVIGEVLDGRMAPGEVRAFGAAHGFNLAMAEAWLAAKGKR